MQRTPPPADGLFTLENGRYHPSEFTRGPWRPDAQHGGPPAALLGHISIPEVAAAEFLSHIEVELVRPVPLEPLRAEVRRERVSGRVGRIHAALVAGDQIVARSNALVLRRTDAPPPDADGGGPGPAIDPPDEVSPVDPPRWASGDRTTYHRNAVEHRFTEGTFREPGPATDWVRLRQPIVSGAEPAPLERVLAAADFGSGVSAIYGAESRFGLINANLSVSLWREAAGEWVSIESTTRLGPQGTGLGVTHLGDRGGRIGVATQGLLGYSMG